MSRSLKGIWAHRALNRPVSMFREEWAVQLNYTHPAIALAEMLHLLMDEHGMDDVERSRDARGHQKRVL